MGISIGAIVVTGIALLVGLGGALLAWRLVGRLPSDEAAPPADADEEEEPSAGEREGRSPSKEEPSAGEREGRSPSKEEPSAGEREGRSPSKEEPAKERE